MLNVVELKAGSIGGLYISGEPCGAASQADGGDGMGVPGQHTAIPMGGEATGKFIKHSNNARRLLRGGRRIGDCSAVVPSGRSAEPSFYSMFCDPLQVELNLRDPHSRRACNHHLAMYRPTDQCYVPGGGARGRPSSQGRP
ncbi:hypothetical protein AMTR_s00001p00272870 [Amborella trichopoda]|uniref:Uncharacterized protein n=1 Tax=Amborella trichopoda TaxID=13333 RepID=W1NN07_AMBTC|nr:hypothetical protein AMTR_s00001p00272870 [Amborella trichopoda]